MQLGRGRDYAWSATSAGQDNVDTFAVDLCEPDGSAPSVDSMHYRFRGACLPIEVLERTNRWTPTPADQTPPGEQVLRAERTKMGLVAGRGTVRGRPVAFTRLRSTYFHEVDSAVGFMDFNDPAAVHSPESFQRAASKIGYTFNWFYADAEHIAYFNSGANPVRARRVNHDFPVAARYEWRGWDPEAWTARFTAFRRHPRVIDQRYLVNWNNKQARGYRASDSVTYSSTYRSVLLEDRLKRAIRGGRRLTLPQAVDIMELAGTSDLRAHAVLPLALRVIGRPRGKLGAAVAELRAWRRAGGLRRDHDRDGVYEHAERDPDPGRVVAALDHRRVRARARPRRAAHAHRDRRHRQRAQHRRRAQRLRLPGRLVRLRAARTCARCWAARCAAATRASTAAAGR